MRKMYQGSDILAPLADLANGASSVVYAYLSKDWVGLRDMSCLGFRSEILPARRIFCIHTGMVLPLLGRLRYDSTDR